MVFEEVSVIGSAVSVVVLVVEANGTHSSSTWWVPGPQETKTEGWQAIKKRDVGIVIIREGVTGAVFRQ